MKIFTLGLGNLNLNLKSRCLLISFLLYLIWTLVVHSCSATLWVHGYSLVQKIHDVGGAHSGHGKSNWNLFGWAETLWEINSALITTIYSSHHYCHCQSYHWYHHVHVYPSVVSTVNRQPSTNPNSKFQMLIHRPLLPRVNSKITH